MQSSKTVVFQINEKGEVDSTYIRNRQISNRYKKCESCETLILQYFNETKWLPGTIGEVNVKSTDYMMVNFTIRDPNDKKEYSPFE